jgi:hypothetical protein
MNSTQLGVLVVLILAANFASAQHCRKVEIDKSTGYCTVPDRSITPGEMDASLACSTHGRLHHVSDSDQALVLAAYGLPATTRKSSGEFDHWYPEWMGGSDGPKNIWFEPHAGKFGSYAKDKVEAVLYKNVCVDHSMSVHQAKKQLDEGWTKLVPE